MTMQHIQKKKNKMHTFQDNAPQVSKEQIMHILRKYIHLSLKRQLL